MPLITKIKYNLDEMEQVIKLSLTEFEKNGGPSVYSKDAVELLLMTSAQETQFRNVKQISGGPAIGLYQMEPQTHDDIWNTFLCDHPLWACSISKMGFNKGSDHLFDPKYATIMCRLKYYRLNQPIPLSPLAKAAYWKKYYNTPLGSGTVAECMKNYKIYCC